MGASSATADTSTSTTPKRAKADRN
jgi:hypothetical protein